MRKGRFVPCGSVSMGFEPLIWMGSEVVLVSMQDMYAAFVGCEQSIPQPLRQPLAQPSVMLNPGAWVGGSQRNNTRYFSK